MEVRDYHASELFTATKQIAIFFQSSEIVRVPFRRHPEASLVG
jgi:hypothetical protein